MRRSNEILHLHNGVGPEGRSESLCCAMRSS